MALRARKVSGAFRETGPWTEAVVVYIQDRGFSRFVDNMIKQKAIEGFGS